MRKIACVATFAGREKALNMMLRSIKGQFDEVFIYDNEKNPDLKDNGKFTALESISEPCYYFCLDDDIHYSPDFENKTTSEIEKRKCIVTYHGRILKGLDLSYYKGHDAFSFKRTVAYKGRIHVPGTGCTAFRTDYFHPKGLHLAKDQRMSDIIFALEAAKQGKRIEMIPHHHSFLKQLPIDHSQSCYTTQVMNESRQIELSNEIFKIISKK